MNIHIIGAGIVGLSTAYVLAREGHQVTLLERQSGAAQAASFAPAGLIGALAPALWPARPGRARAWRQTSGFPALDLAILNWHQRRWASQRQQAHAQALAAVLASASSATPAFADAPAQTESTDPAASGASTPAPAGAAAPAAGPARSQEQDEDDIQPGPALALARHLRLAYEHASGHLIALRTDAEAQAWQRLLPHLQARGLEARWQDADAVRRMEPGLNPDTALAGAIEWPRDEVGNCRQMALALKAELARLGASLRFNAGVARLERPDRAGAWRLHLGTGETVQAQHVVLCAGAGATGLLHPLGLQLPLQEIHGHALSAALREPLHAPRHAAFTDARTQVCITRQGQRIRVAGAYRLGAHAAHPQRSASAALYRGLADWFPGAAILDDSVQSWSATVLATPDDQPIVGASGLPGLWLNVGHGLQGWAQSLDCAQATAAFFGGGKP